MYSLLAVDRWDDDLDEPAGGGRCIATVPTAREAVKLQSIYAPVLAHEHPGELLVVTDHEHRRIDPYLRAMDESAPASPRALAVGGRPAA